MNVNTENFPHSILSNPDAIISMKDAEVPSSAVDGDKENVINRREGTPLYIVGWRLHLISSG